MFSVSEEGKETSPVEVRKICTSSFEFSNFVVNLHPKKSLNIGIVHLRKHLFLYGFVHQQECLLQWNYDRPSEISSFSLSSNSDRNH